MLSTIQPNIVTINKKQLVGLSLNMNLANNLTFKLWQSFMPRRKEIKNAIEPNLFSVQIYPPTFDFSFSDPSQPFEKYAAIEVNECDDIPIELCQLTIPGGLYAVFHYKGLSTDPSIFHYIYGEWLPYSDYVIDDRPHFEILGTTYKNNHPDSEEDIYIPIQLKSLPLK